MSEHEIAVMEGERNASEQAYFKARPQIDTGGNHQLFRAGFERGFRCTMDAFDRANGILNDLNKSND